MEYCEELGYWTNSNCCGLCEMRYFCDARADETEETEETDETDELDEPHRFFHDHPVIDERPDGYYMYWSGMSPILSHNPIHLSEQDMNPPED